jgi:cell division protein FtsB
MDLERYRILREKFKNKTFEKKHQRTTSALYVGSFIANIGSVFFAFFFINPSFDKTISNLVGAGVFSMLCSIVLTITFLGFFEFIKREIFKNFSADYIESEKKFADRSQIMKAIMSGSLIALSFYFSLTGAMEFSKISVKKNEVIEQNSTKVIDSLRSVAEVSKKPYNEEIEDLRASNKDLRDKRDNTPMNLRSTRNQYNQLIDDNEKSIEENLAKIQKIDDKLSTDLASFDKQLTAKKNANTDSDTQLIWLFLIISTTIETIIILGVYHKELFDFKTFIENETIHEPILAKRSKYEFLLKIVYKNGDIQKEQQVISLNKLTEIVKNKAVYNPRMVRDFYTEMTHVGAFKVIANKRYAMVNYDEAKKMINTIEGL